MRRYELFDKLEIRPRRSFLHSGLFRYVDPITGFVAIFDWDDAGIDAFGRSVVIEVESSKPVTLHIQGHLARLALMQSLGESVSKVVWIVRSRDYDFLRRIVEAWFAFSMRTRTSNPPIVEFWTQEAERLGFLQHRKPP